MTNLEWLRTLDEDEMVAAIGEISKEFSDFGDFKLFNRLQLYLWIKAEHEEPDTWVRVEEDALMPCIEYCDERQLMDGQCNALEGDDASGHCDSCSLSCESRKCLDLVRRCKAIAKRKGWQ